MSAAEFKIDFLGVGVEKAGTSWVAECLAQHPQICFASQKEVHFFNKNHEKGLTFYQSYFKNYPLDNEKKGEFTPRYFYNQQVPERIKKHFPQVKIIICLRNPLDRLHSHYYHNIAHGRLSQKVPLEKAIQHNPDFINYGMYSQMLKKYFNIFSRENILVIIYKDIQEKPQQIIQQIYNFIGVDQNFIPPALHQQVNSGAEKKYHSFLIKKILRSLMCFTRKIKQNKCGNLILKILTKLGFKKLFQIIFRLNIKSQEKVKPLNNKQPLSLELKQKLINIYKHDIQETNKLIEQDVSWWQII